ncbi:MAG: hypothetical protein R2792_12285 [Saprospiraceae bacterium]
MQPGTRCRQCEARESVGEVLARQEDNALLAEKIGVLNRQMGEQDAGGTVTKRTDQPNRSNGESSNKLAQQKAQVESPDLALGQGLAAAHSNDSICCKGQKRSHKYPPINPIKLIEIYPATSGATVALQNEEVILARCQTVCRPALPPTKRGNNT